MHVLSTLVANGSVSSTYTILTDLINKTVTTKLTLFFYIFSTFTWYRQLFLPANLLLDPSAQPAAESRWRRTLRRWRRRRSRSANRFWSGFAFRFSQSFRTSWIRSSGTTEVKVLRQSPFKHFRKKTKYLNL